MLSDARNLPAGTVIETDVCIVGAGAAGITIAREFAGQPQRLCLLESGDMEFNLDTQLLYKGDNIGRPYYPLHGSRFRLFGGTTIAWGGLCRPIDEQDLEEREWVPYSGWPIKFNDVDPFYERAHEVCELGPYTYSVDHWSSAERPALPFKRNRIRTTMFQNSTPTHFGKAYGEELKRADNIQVFLNANVTNIETDKTSNAVTHLDVATLAGNKFTVKAKYFVIATGGIENARLLLNSNKTQKTGLGNEHDLVGRFFMEHPIMETGAIILTDSDFPKGLYKRHYIDNVPLHGVLTLTEQTLREEEMLNCGLLLNSTNWSKSSEATSSLKEMFEQIGDGEMPDDFMEHLGNVISDIDDVASAAYNKMMDHKLFVLTYWAEPEPNPDSRVLLDGEKDALGVNRANLDWRLGSKDKRNLIRMHEILAEELGFSGLGRLKEEFSRDDSTWPKSMRGSYHHMGTTKMNEDPKLGVVDKNCRVHSVPNLYMAGSSIFPNPGHANPMPTICALALRLSDHIKELMT